jgi:fucose permease
MNSSRAATEVHFRPSALAGATSSFVLIGATAAMYGPLLISFSHKFHLSLPTTGAVISVNFVGAIFGVLLAWIGVKRFTGALVLSAASLLLAVGAFTSALSSLWSPFLVGVFVIGLGFGGLDFTLNTLLARTAIQGRVFRMNLGASGYGLGAVIGPLIIIAMHPRNFPLLFGAVGAIAVLLSMLHRGVHAPALRHEVNQQQVTMMRAQRRPILLTFIVAYVLYISVETSSSGWMATQVHGVGYSEQVGILVTAGFWAGVAIGRALGTPLYHLLSERKLVLGGLGLATVLCCVADSSQFAPYAYPLLGLVISLIFPMGLIWYLTICPHDSDGLAIMMLIMMAGGVIGPALESLMVSAFSVHVVPLVIAALALLDLAVFSTALRFKPLFATSASASRDP